MEADGVHVRVCTTLLRKVVLLGCIIFSSLHPRVPPIAHAEERVSLSLFLKFLWLEIMYFSWPRMKALE